MEFNHFAHMDYIAKKLLLLIALKVVYKFLNLLGTLAHFPSEMPAQEDCNLQQI
jgi:hypothetical protein